MWTQAWFYETIWLVPNLLQRTGKQGTNTRSNKIIMVTDPISNMLVTIKNVQDAGRKETVVEYSRVKESIAKLLIANGYLNNCKIINQEGFKKLSLELCDRKINKVRRISKPGQRVFKKANSIPRPMGGLALIIISTSRGLMTGKDAKSRGLGGELVCEVY